MLTGKAEKLFEDWYRKNQEESGSGDMPSLNGISYECRGFYRYSKSMQWGVLLEFGRSQDVWIEVISEMSTSHFIKFLAEDIMSPFFELCEPLYVDGEYEEVVYPAAIEKLNQLINEK